MNALTRTMLAAAIACGLSQAAPAGTTPLTTAFTYQGNLTNGGSPIDGLVDMQFSLWEVAVGAPQVGGTITQLNVNVQDGLFTTTMDFGAAFDANERFLQIAVRFPAGGGAYTTLLPRQKLTVSPFAAFSLNAASAALANNANTAALATNATQLNGQAAAFYQNASNLNAGTLASARLSGAYANALTLSNAANVFTGVGTGLTALNASNLTSGTVADARLSTNVMLLAGAQTVTGAKTFNADLNFGNDGVSLIFPATVAPSSPMINMFASGTGNDPRMVIGHSNGFAAWGMKYTDATDTFRFQSSDAADGVSIELFTAEVGIHTDTPDAPLHVVGESHLEGTVTLHRTGGLSPIGELHTSGDMEYHKNFDSTTNDASWHRWFTEAGTIENMRIQSGDEATINGDGTFTSNGIDYAEAFKATEANLEPGDVVSLTVGQWEFVRRSPGALDPHIVGVVSTAPAFCAGMSFDQEESINPVLTAQRNAARAEGNVELERQLTEQMTAAVKQAYRPIALAGRVPCKVDAQFGAIRAGDRLTSSATPGHAMKQTQPGQSIGIALEDFNEGVGTIIVLVQPGWHGGSAGDPLAALGAALAPAPAPADETADLRARIEALERLVSQLRSAGNN